MIDRIPSIATALCLVGLLLMTNDKILAELVISPARVVLDGPESSQQLLVIDGARQLKSLALTRVAKFKIANPALARIDAEGLVQPLAEGQTDIIVSH
jgi:hypothetical protein